jgi:hypothetical protein
MGVSVRMANLLNLSVTKTLMPYMVSQKNQYIDFHGSLALCLSKLTTQTKAFKLFTVYSCMIAHPTRDRQNRQGPYGMIQLKYESCPEMPIAKEERQKYLAFLNFHVK